MAHVTDGLSAGLMVLFSLVVVRAAAAWHRRAAVAGRLRSPRPTAVPSLAPWMRRAAAAVMGPVLRRRRMSALETALPGALEAVARGLRSGASLRQALAEAAGATTGPVAGDLARVVSDLEDGLDPVDALERWVERRPLAGVGLAVAALCLGAETGGPQARAVDGVAGTLRQRLAAQAEARALATQARLSAWVIAAAPLGFSALAAAIDPRSATFLFTTPIGLACAAAGLALDAVGAAWMARLTRVEL